MANGTVGELRQAMALMDADSKVEIVSSDPKLAELLSRLRIVHCYPDTTDRTRQRWVETFKIEVAESSRKECGA